MRSGADSEASAHALAVMQNLAITAVGKLLTLYPQEGHHFILEPLLQPLLFFEHWSSLPRAERKSLIEQHKKATTLSEVYFDLLEDRKSSLVRLL